MRAGSAAGHGSYGGGAVRQMAKSVADIVAEAAGAVTERIRQAGERLDVCVHPTLASWRNPT